MAYLNSLVVTGGSRFLNKIYANSIDVSGEFGVSGNMSIGGTLNVTGATTLSSTLGVTGTGTFSGAVSVAGTLTLSKTTDASGTANNSPALIVGGAATSSHMEFSKNKIQSKNTGTTVANMSINPDGGLVTIGSGGLTVAGASTLGTANITNGNIDTASITNGTASNFNVTNIFRATRFDLQSVAQLGGAFYVSPTIMLPNSGTTFTTSIANGFLTIVISDSSITSTEIAGVVWAANAKVKASGKIGNTITGTMDGTVTAINTTAHTLTIKVSGENALSVVAGTYQSSQISNFTVMLYETSDSKPVGIILNSYGTNHLAYIDIYGGSSTTPNVRIGNIGGLTFNGSTLTNQWGIFTNNGYYSGKIVANGGAIGGFEIGTDSIHTSGVVVTSNAENSVALSSSTFTRTINGTSRTGLKLAIGSNFGVSSTGVLYVGNAIVSGAITSTSGTIGGWTIDTNSLKNGTFGTANSAIVCTGTSTAKSIGGSASISGWTFTSGANFGVTKTGSLYASDANIAGLIKTNSITATGGELNIVDTNDNICTTINTDGLIVYKDGTQIASFGETSIVGDSNYGNITTTPDGIAVQDGATALATFGADGVVIGEDGKSQVVVSPQKIEMISNDGGTHFRVDVMRNIGIYVLNQLYMGGSTNIVKLQYKTSDSVTILQPKVDNVATEHYTSTSEESGDMTIITFTFDPAYLNYRARMSVGYSMNGYSPYYTFGARKGGIGSNNIWSYVIGFGNEASAKYSIATGHDTTASGESSFSGGTGTIASGANQVVIGKYNVDNSNNVFIIGNGTDDVSRSNVMAVTNNGNVEIALDATAASGTTDGDLYAAITALGWENEVIV